MIIIKIFIFFIYKKYYVVYNEHNINILLLTLNYSK